MKFILTLIALILIEFSAALPLSKSKKGQDCLIKYLKEKGMLEEEFLTTNSLSGCDLATRLVIPEMINLHLAKLSEAGIINADCVAMELRKSGIYDFMLKENVIESTNLLDLDEITRRLRDVRITIKDILDNASTNCDSDHTFAGLYNNYLGIKNETLVVLQNNYCYAKFAVDEKLIEIGDLNINPGNINIAAVNCNQIVSEQKTIIIATIIEKYNKKNVPQHQIDCVLNAFSEGKAVEKSIALEVLEELKISLEMKKRNREKLTCEMEGIFFTGLECLKK